jgi:hypothetical protein
MFLQQTSSTSFYNLFLEPMNCNVFHSLFNALCSGKTPLDIALEKGHHALVELMRFPGIRTELVEENRDEL